MPELPEVETIRQILDPQIQGRTITKVTVHRQEVLAHPAANEFCRRVTGQTFAGMERRGKFLIARLTDGSRILLHLRMTGCLLLAPAEVPQEKHTHVIFHLENGRELRFSDTRRFGRFWLLGKEESDTYSRIEQLGPDPFDPCFSAQYLRTAFAKRKKKIKECLMDQRMIAGIGNIYSDEILFAARICPSRPANTLTDDEWERLTAAIPERLSYFIEKNRITPEEYLETKGQDYRNTPFLQVYGQEGKPCPVCKEPLCKRIIGGRSSVYCPKCQKNP